MYRNLEAELKRLGINRTELAKKIKINISSLSGKLNGTRPLTLQEAKEIKKIFGDKFTIDYLFTEQYECTSK